MKKIPFLLSLFLLLASCTPGPIPTIGSESITFMPVVTPAKTKIATPSRVLTLTDGPNDNVPQCLSPLREFEYPLVQGDPLPGWLPDEPENLLPPQEWQKIVIVPDASELMLVQTHNSETVFWVNTMRGEFIRYQVNGEQLNNGILVTGPMSGNFIFFLDRENNVWKARFNELDIGDKHPEALLSRYNEQINQWEPVVFDLENQDTLGIRRIEVDSEGTFWFLVIDKTKYQLYSFDPRTMITKHHLADYAVYPTFVISHNTLFILSDRLEKDISPRYVLIMYALDSSSVKTYHVPSRFYSYGGEGEDLPRSLFVDSQQRVWLGTRGWIDLSSDDTYEWHIVVPNPVFIDVFPGAGTWVWGEPEITHETSDGLLWYSALRGTGWVDSKVGKWCVFTSYGSNVLADSQGNLWILVNGWLYRHK